LIQLNGTKYYKHIVLFIIKDKDKKMSNNNNNDNNNNNEQKIIMYDDVHLSLVNIPVNTFILFAIPFREVKKIKSEKDVKNHSLLSIAIQHGFKHPIVSSKIDIPEKAKQDYLCLFHKYDHNYGKKINKNQTKQTEYSVIYCITNYKKTQKNKKNCSLYINLSKKTVDYLQLYTKKYKFNFKNKQEQREISGKFITEPISENSVIVNIVEEETDLGDKEKADYSMTIASFHTHPLEAYQKYSVCAAYPSVDDYITILHIYANHFGMFHITATIEGIYIITVKTEKSQEYILKNFENYIDYIEENYAIDYPECDKNDIGIDTNIRKKQIKSYVNKVNRFKIFNVIFKSWEDTLEPILIKYKPVNGSCVLSDEQVSLFGL